MRKENVVAAAREFAGEETAPGGCRPPSQCDGVYGAKRVGDGFAGESAEGGGFGSVILLFSILPFGRTPGAEQGRTSYVGWRGLTSLGMARRLGGPSGPALRTDGARIAVHPRTRER